MVRDLLQNRPYTGRVGHADTIYKGSLGERRTTKRNRSEWFEGRHAPIVSDELFELCQQARAEAVKVRHAGGKANTYVLGDRVFCGRCAARKPADIADEGYGRMRPGHQVRGDYFFYRCMAHDRGYRNCGQPFAHADTLDAQLLEELASLTLPDDVRVGIEQAVAGRIENEANLKRMAELTEIVERIDLKWENGFMDRDAYLAKRGELQREIEEMRPIDYDDLAEAADLLQHFRSYWDACAETENPAEARKELVARVVDRVYVDNGALVAIVLHGDYAVVLGENETPHANIASAVQKRLVERGFNENSACNRSGDDGGQPLPGYWILFRRGKALKFFVPRLTERTVGTTRHLLSDNLVSVQKPSSIRYRMPEPIGISHSHS
jgi:hypothetical protein